MVFRKPAEDQRMGLLLLVALVVQLIVFPLTGAILTGKLFLWVLTALGAGLTYYFYFVLNFAGPDDIRLDGNERTYEWTTGWWKPIKRRGSFDDIKSIDLGAQNQVWLTIGKESATSKNTVLLNSSGTRVQAQAFAEDVSREFGFPIVPYKK